LFYYVYTKGIIEHVEVHREVIIEIGRTLRSGGRAIIGVLYKWDIFLRPLIVKYLEYYNKYPYSPEKSFSFVELADNLKKAGFRIIARTGIRAFTGILSMAELFLFKCRIPSYKLLSIFIRLFEFMESIWAWSKRLGYLLVMVVEKTG
jgi:SAM-dependent methyltransferase